MDPFLNQAAVNVGGIVLNALAIEHFILRHPYEPQQVCEINIYPLLDPIYALTKLKMELDLLGRFLFLANEFMST
jgi:hypothetical protein